MELDVQRISLKRKATSLATVLALAVVIVLATGAAAFAATNPNDNINTAITVPTPLPVSLTLNGAVDLDYGDNAVYSVYLNAGDTLFAGVTEYYGFYLFAFGPTATDINEDMPVEWMPSILGDLHYVAPTSGTYYLAVMAMPDDGSGAPVAGTASLWAGALRKTSTSILTTYETATSSKTTASTSLVLPFNTLCSFDGTLTAAAGGVAYEPLAVLRQYAGGKQTKVANAWTFGEEDAGFWAYVPFPVDGVKRKVTYTFQFAGTDPEAATAEGLGFSTNSVTITPRPYMTTPTSASSVYHGKAFTMYNILLPRHTSGGYPVRFYCERYERLSNGKYAWRLRKTVNAKAYNTTYTNYAADLYSEPGSKCQASVVLPYAGKWRVRAYHGDADHYPTYSGYKAVTAK